RVHLGRLLELEYVIAHRGKRGQCFDYELVYQGEAEGDASRRFVLGLGEIAPEISGYDQKFGGSKNKFGGSKGKLHGGYRGQTGPIPAGTGIGDRAQIALKTRPNGAVSRRSVEITVQAAAREKSAS